MLHETVQEIQTALRGIEQQETPWIEANFVERVDALDMLAWRILERIENVQYGHGYHAELAGLYHRGTQLWQRLEAVNTQLFGRLRAQIVASSSPGPTLRQLCAMYVGGVRHEPTWQDLEA